MNARPEECLLRPGKTNSGENNRCKRRSKNKRISGPGNWECRHAWRIRPVKFVHTHLIYNKTLYTSIGDIL